jgi:hypothetical protein
MVHDGCCTTIASERAAGLEASERLDRPEQPTRSFCFAVRGGLGDAPSEHAPTLQPSGVSERASSRESPTAHTAAITAIGRCHAARHYAVLAYAPTVFGALRSVLELTSRLNPELDHARRTHRPLALLLNPRSRCDGFGLEATTAPFARTQPDAAAALREVNGSRGSSRASAVAAQTRDRARELDLLMRSKAEATEQQVRRLDSGSTCRPASSLR